MANQFGFFLTFIFSIFALGMAIASCFFPTYTATYTRRDWETNSFLGVLEYGVNLLQPDADVQNCDFHTPPSYRAQHPNMKSKDWDAQRTAECSLATKRFKKVLHDCTLLTSRSGVETAFLVLGTLGSATTLLLCLVMLCTFGRYGYGYGVSSILCSGHEAPFILTTWSVATLTIIFYTVAWATILTTFSSVECHWPSSDYAPRLPAAEPVPVNSTANSSGGAAEELMKSTIQESGVWSRGQTQFMMQLAAFGFSIAALLASIFGACCQELDLDAEGYRKPPPSFRGLGLGLGYSCPPDDYFSNMCNFNDEPYHCDIELHDPAIENALQSSQDDLQHEIAAAHHSCASESEPNKEEQCIIFDRSYAAACDVAAKHNKGGVPLANALATLEKSCRAGQLFASGLAHCGYTGVLDLLNRPDHFILAFHGTKTPEAICSIFKEGFDTTRRCGQAHGPGEYFDTGSGSLARDYWGTTKCLIITIIITKNQNGTPVPEVSTHSNVAVVNNPLPPDKFTSTTPRGGGGPRGHSAGLQLPPYALVMPIAVVGDRALNSKVQEAVKQQFREAVPSSSNVNMKILPTTRVVPPTAGGPPPQHALPRRFHQPVLLDDDLL